MRFPAHPGLPWRLVKKQELSADHAGASARQLILGAFKKSYGAADRRKAQREPLRTCPGESSGLQLSRVLACSLTGRCIQLAESLFFRFGKVEIGLLQLLTPLATLFVVSRFRQASASRSLLSKEFCRSHFRASESPAIALQHSFFCNATVICRFGRPDLFKIKTVRRWMTVSGPWITR
jgi:hypothetical protein